MPYLFTPPQREMTVLLEGSLRYTYPVSQTVWKDANGVWVSQECPAGDVLATAQRLLSISGRPEIVDNATAAELLAAGIGQVIPIEP